MGREGKRSLRPAKAKGRKPAPSADAAWSARVLGRRQVLKGVVAGSGVVASAMSLPKEWTKPVVQSIVASAQAQVSPLGIPVPVAPVPPPPPLPPIGGVPRVMPVPIISPPGFLPP